jgi:hypothetical protein
MWMLFVEIHQGRKITFRRKTQIIFFWGQKLGHYGHPRDKEKLT